MKQGELLKVTTSDGVRLDGILHRASGAPSLGVDIVIFHHGRGTNFYGSSMTGELSDYFLNNGCSVLRVNNRGHDHAYQSPHGWLGSAYEIVDDFRYDNKAWLDFAEASGYHRVLAWGHSLGAVKLIYLLGIEPDERIVRAIASSPPRFNHGAFVAGADGARRLASFETANSLIAADRPDALVEFDFGVSMWFSAVSLLDKYGPADRYDFFRYLSDINVPLLVTLGELEDSLGFQSLAAEGAALAEHQSNLSYELVEGADHSYATRIPEIWSLASKWLQE